MIEINQANRSESKNKNDFEYNLSGEKVIGYDLDDVDANNDRAVRMVEKMIQRRLENNLGDLYFEGFENEDEDEEPDFL